MTSFGKFSRFPRFQVQRVWSTQKTNVFTYVTKTVHYAFSPKGEGLNHLKNAHHLATNCSLTVFQCAHLIFAQIFVEFFMYKRVLGNIELPVRTRGWQNNTAQERKQVRQEEPSGLRH